MIHGTFRRKAIALLAAYGLALQGLLTAFVPIAAAFPAGVICSDQSPDSHPAGDGPSCASACAMLGGIAGPLPPDVVIAVQLVQAAPQTVPSAAPVVAAPRGPPTARAPPSV